MTDMSNSTTEVTAEWVKTLRSIVKGAKSIDSVAIVVDYRKDIAGCLGSTATLVVEKREPAAEYGRVQLRYVQPLVPAAVEAYTPDRRPLRSGGRDAFRLVAQASHYHTDVRSPLRTLAAILKPGDELKAYFLIANDGPFAVGKGITTDQCHLSVYRKGKLIASVHIRTETLPVESTVTMIDSSYRGEAN